MLLFIPVTPNTKHTTTLPDKFSQASDADQFTILSSVGHELRECCSSFGIDIDAVAEPMGIDVASFDDFEARISFQRFCQLLDALGSMSNQDAFGLIYAQHSKRGATGPFGLGLAAAPKFKDMLNFYAKYVHIVVDLFSFDAIVERDRFTIEWSYSPLMSRTEQYADFAAAVGMRIFEQHAGGPIEPLHARLQRSP
ncbi:MAG: AraC family transcriptional regulator ligand-binding domain-containing protein, partial [Rhizobiaceae bacterium]